MARNLVRALIQQMLLEGFFHGDPHPGNVVMDAQTGRITFLDMGLVGELAQEQRFDLLALIWALKSSDPGMLATIIRRFASRPGPSTRRHSIPRSNASSIARGCMAAAPLAA